MSAWGCPHDANGVCQKVPGAVCAPGMRGCVLEGRVKFSDPQLNQPRRPQRAEKPQEPEALTKPRRRLPF